jgi:hypothetical protein
MARTNIVSERMAERCVEPVPRMVAGRFGYAFHRFPIKGGITPMEAMRALLREQLSRDLQRPSYFGQLLRRGAEGPNGLRGYGNAIGGDPLSVEVVTEVRKLW